MKELLRIRDRYLLGAFLVLPGGLAARATAAALPGPVALAVGVPGRVFPLPGQVEGVVHDPLADGQSAPLFRRRRLRTRSGPSSSSATLRRGCAHLAAGSVPATRETTDHFVLPNYSSASIAFLA